MVPRKILIGITLGFIVICINSAIVRAGDTHSCFHCDNEKCEDPVIAECKTVKEIGKCFIRFDGSSNDVVQLGCLSNFNNEGDIEELIKKKTLYICDDVNCNDLAKLPNPNLCAECSSSKEEACATKPTTITKQQSCKKIPYTHCYQRVKDGDTIRGCLYDLEGDEFYKCLTGGDDKCKICEGGNCNEDIIPSDRRRCHRCSSETDSSCQNSPLALSVCPTYNETDICVAVYENDITKRGCLTEFECDANSKNCQVCSSDGCNSANIRRRFEHPYGIFQDLPLNCNTCKGDDCDPGKPSYPNKCEGDDYQDCMTVFEASGKVIRRGCENVVLDEYQSHCDAFPELCFRCKANGCNNMTNPSEYQECLYCESSINPDCLLNPSSITTTRNCTLGCVTSLYPRKSKPKLQDFVRTCFEDIEPDNHGSCTAENDCIKCSDNKCNTAILPSQGRLSCLHCEGSNCDVPISKQCVSYNPNDMCYIYFDNVTSSAVRMGCRSDVEDDKLKAEIKQYFICDGDDCNDFKNLPESIFCYVCDSENDINCAINPSKITVQYSCNNLPYTQCFTRIRDGGHTQRGCLSKLSTDDFISCHDGSPSSKCRICTDNKCNKNIYPGDRQLCYRCNSTTDANCEDKPDARQYCPRYIEDDACVTQFINGITRRDCASEITCEGLDYKSCRKCRFSSCNYVNLANENIGDVGLFTNLPLRCHQCNSVAECKNLNGVVELCTGNINQSCATVFNEAGVVKARGCSDSLESICSSEGILCFNCKSNGCNLANHTNDYINCVHCDAKNSDDCIFNVEAVKRTRKCYKSCMTALYPRSKDELPAYELIRTCLDDKDLDDRNKCESSDDPYCKSCTGNNCNKDDLGKRKSCYQCKSSECLHPKVQTCRAVMDNDQCFLQWDESGSLIEMGCKSKYESLEVQTLVNQKYLWLCNDDNCNHIENAPKPQNCLICNSRTDKNCAIEPNAIFASTTCDKTPYTQCYSRILEDGHTERGCMSSLEGEEFLDCLYNKSSSKCLACTGNKCNQKLYPSNRLSCHACSSTSSVACESNPNAVQVCLLYTENNKCVTSIDINGNTIRGCSSKISCDMSNTTICQECVSDSCNSANLKRKADGKPGQWQSLPLTCLSCNSLKECIAGSSQLKCTDFEYCMTVFDTNGKVVKRGCSDEVEKDQGTYCDLSSSNCLNCNSNLCNKAESLQDLIECVYCDSKINPACSHNPSAVKYLRKCNGGCMTALYPTANNYSYELVRTCVDDKDLTDQIVCSTGSSKECKSCSSSACNNHKLPERRLSCFYCQGENCEDAQKSECMKYKPDDQCFIQFNNVSDIVRMGCISDLEENFVSNNLHILFMCSSGDNCNGYENLPQSTVCAVCNSNDDEDCASNPKNVSTMATCTALPNTQCYTKVNKDGSTHRDCVNRLTPFEINACLRGTDSDCNVCSSDGCNIKIFPADRRSCQRCNTKDDTECESSPNSTSICPVYSKTQFCATKLVNGHTYRGCSTEFICDDSDKQYCRLCLGSDNCNFIDLASNNIGYPGNWQSVPINCYTCKNEECNEQTPIQVCQNNNNQNCATVFAPNGTVVQRGCSDLIYNGENSNYCDENVGYCKFCKSNGCNMAKNLTDFSDCLFCEGADNVDCVLHPENIKRTRSCHKGCMIGLYPRKYEDNPAYQLARGCMDDLELDDREDCKAGVRPYCQVCDGVSCNTAKIPEHRLKCNACTGEDCDEPTSAECRAFRENDQCFTLFTDENNVARMGCASDFDNYDLNILARHLLLCDGDNCNTFESFPTPISCRSCNSMDNSECAFNPKISTAAVCNRLPHTECCTRIDKNGVTYRGCLSDVEDDVFSNCSSGNSTSCEVCTTNDCNTKIYPEGRRSCIQCDSIDYPSCENNAKGFASVCTIYDKDDSCVTKLEGSRTIRGCASEISCGTVSNSTCLICNRTDNCNTINILASYVGDPGKWQGLPLSCHQCEGKACNSDNGTLSKCEGNKLQTCMTVFNTEGIVVQRGCSDAVINNSSDYCDENGDKCFACKSNACNNASSLKDYIDCYFCDSADSSSCAINFDALNTKTRKCQKSCMVALYPGSSGNDPSYELTRTCLDDMDLDDREECAKGNKELCKACNGSRCNAMNVPDERFECYKCIDHDCEDMKPQQCTSYHPNEQCYTLFNNQSSIVAMGCRSEFEPDIVKELIRKKRLLLCNEKKCNAPESLPTPKFCSVCNSAENPLCATNPNLVNNIQRCATLPFTECYTRVNAYGHTERGCLGSLSEDYFYGCLMNTYGLCETCVGDKCNEIDIYPNDRRKCHHCSSDIDPKCASKPNSNKVCELYKEDDYCVTNFQNGVTSRGCRSNFKCDNENDPIRCRVCENDGCNIINIEKIIENGFPGRWQDIPITCYTCKGEVECSSKDHFRPCEKNPVQNCMTVFNSDGNVTQRGCSDSVENDNQEYCAENPDKCLRCNSNGCNEASGLIQYVKCLNCDRDSKGSCISNVTEIATTRQCYKFCMTALYPLFQEKNPSFGLSRSCYDDMDLDDRELCAAGKKEHCKVCNTTNCNIIDMPEVRLSCYICKGDDCQDPKSQECPTYRPDDKCYTQFNDKNKVVAFGCRSQFSNVEADYLLKEKRLHLCYGKNCNSLKNIPAAVTCALCNSRTDKYCASFPEYITSETVCDVLPHTNCYSRVLDDGATERGCLSNLYDDEFLGCLNATSATCTTCNEKYCNKEVFPKSRLKCHICNSLVHANCEDSPQHLTICYKYDPEDTCVTALRNNNTYRDCSSNLVCDVTNPKTCKTCSGDGCNTVNLAKIEDDNFGMWQDLPLTCLTCSGNDCDSEASIKSMTCNELNNRQDCVTVFDVNDKVIARGCSDSIESKYCLGNEDNCYKCKSNNCNVASSKLNYEECIYCNSHNDQECVWNPLSATLKTRNCQGGCMTALFPSYNSDNSSYELIRTCLNDKELPDQKTCSKGKDKNCSACSGNKCNIKNIPENRLSCFACIEGTCEEPEAKICPLYKENDQCFIRFDDTNSVAEMGCISSFRNQDLESIIKTKRVHVCLGENCNNLGLLPGAQSCAACDSIYDVSCAVNPIDIGTHKTCSMLPYTSCYSILTYSGNTVRGCLADLDEYKFAACVLGHDKNCSVCNESGCNRKIFPEDRQQCFTCISTEESNCDSFPKTKRACPVVSETETCISALSGNVTVRGCKSLIHCDSSDSDTCRSCFGSECNSIDLLNKHDDGYHGVWQELPLKCHTCEGEDCLYSLGPTIQCSSRNINQDCMTVFDEQGRIERRGCSDEVEDYKDLYCRQHPEHCFRCKSNECNIAWSMEEYVECLFCDSAHEPLCVLNPDYNEFKSRKCYKSCMVAMRDQQIIRSCLDDKEMWVQHNCQQNDSKECIECSEGGCNNFVFPNDRLKCHVCTDSSCTSSVSHYCELYESNDFCIAKYENGSVNLMGCASSQNASDIAEWTAQNKLHKCEGSDCNEISLLPKDGVCVLCDSNQIPNCAQNPAEITTTTICAAPSEKCASGIDSQGHTIRGCFSNLTVNEQSCESLGTCAVCSGEKCNNQIYPANRRECHICDSRADNKCRENPSSLKVCAIYDPNDMCVSALDFNDLLQRGCASQLQCSSKDSDYCDVCNINGCNTVALKGSATAATNSIFLTLLLAFASVLRLNY